MSSDAADLEKHGRLSLPATDSCEMSQDLRAGYDCSPLDVEGVADLHGTDEPSGLFTTHMVFGSFNIKKMRASANVRSHQFSPQTNLNRGEFLASILKSLGKL